MMSKEEKIKRSVHIYPTIQLKNKMTKLAEELDISRNELIIQGAKMVMEKYEKELRQIGRR